MVLMQSNSSKLSISTLYTLYEIAYYAMVFCMYGMYTTYMITYGFDTSFIALSLSIVSLISLFSGSIRAYYLDKTNNCRLVHLFYIITTELAVLLFFSPLGKTKLIALIFAIFGYGGITALIGETETWASKLISQGVNMNYGKVRAAGSLSYAVSAFVLGRVLADVGYDFARIIFSIATLLCLITIIQIPNPEFKKEDNKEAKISIKEGFKQISNSKIFLVFMFCNALYMFTNTVCDGYLGPLVLEHGGTSADIGIISSVIALLEFIFMPLYNQFADKYGTRLLLTISFFGMAIKGLIMGNAPSLPFLYISVVMQVFSFVLMIPGKIRLINEEIPRRYIATGLYLSNAVATLVSALIINPLIGQLSSNLGLPKTFIIMSIPSLIAGLIFLAYNYNKKLNTKI